MKAFQNAKCTGGSGGSASLSEIAHGNAPESATSSLTLDELAERMWRGGFSEAIR